MDNERIGQLARGDLNHASRILYFSTSFDILNAAVSEHLDRVLTRWKGMNVTVKESTAGRTCYLLEHNEWQGQPLGEVRVRVLSTQKIELCLISPPRPKRRKFTPDEKAFFAAQPDEDAQDLVSGELIKRAEDERDKSYQRALNLHRPVIYDFLRSLLKEIGPLSRAEGESPEQQKTEHKQPKLGRKELSPDVPKPRDYPTTEAWWDAVFRWERADGKACGVYTDADLGRLIDRSEGTVANNRSRLGWQKHKDSENVNLS